MLSPTGLLANVQHKLWLQYNCFELQVFLLMISQCLRHSLLMYCQQQVTDFTLFCTIVGSSLTQLHGDVCEKATLAPHLSSKPPFIPQNHDLPITNDWDSKHCIFKVQNCHFQQSETSPAKVFAKFDHQYSWPKYFKNLALINLVPHE